MWAKGAAVTTRCDDWLDSEWRQSWAKLASALDRNSTHERLVLVIYASRQMCPPIGIIDGVRRPAAHVSTSVLEKFSWREAFARMLINPRTYGVVGMHTGVVHTSKQRHGQDNTDELDFVRQLQWHLRFLDLPLWDYFLVSQHNPVSLISLA